MQIYILLYHLDLPVRAHHPHCQAGLAFPIFEWLRQHERVIPQMTSSIQWGINAQYKVQTITLGKVLYNKTFAKMLFKMQCVIQCKTI